MEERILAVVVVRERAHAIAQLCVRFLQRAIERGQPRLHRGAVDADPPDRERAPLPQRR